VQIDVPETLGLGQRSGFYEQTGAYRDMVVTHLFQILAFMAMEPPTALEPQPISEEKNKVFRSDAADPAGDVVRGQYNGYRQEPGVAPRAETETFIALKCFIDNWRWAGVPFFLRTGKKMAEGQRIISIAFREPPKSMFPPGSGVGAQGPDHLTFDLADQPQDEPVLLRQAPRPRHAAGQAEPAVRDARHRPDRRRAGGLRAADPDAMRGDHTLFNTAEGIERLWQVSTPCWRTRRRCGCTTGSWGPKSIHQLIAPHAWRLPFERKWREPSWRLPNLSTPYELEHAVEDVLEFVRRAQVRMACSSSRGGGVGHRRPDPHQE
jgi:glucose-6-phosphate 1-dehydrogenase